MNLPPIIQEAPKLILDAINDINYEAKLDLQVKKFVLCITKDLKKEDKALFKDYRFVEYEDDIHKNIPIETYAWDFLVLDLRERGDRYCYMKEVAPNKHKYHVIAYGHAFELDEIDIEYDNALSKFPERQAKKEDFEMLLMLKRIKKPKWYVSLFSCILNFYHKAKN
jgi:hypothetical protein